MRILKLIYALAAETLYSIVTFDDSKDTRCKLNDFKDFAKNTGKTLHILTKPLDLEGIILKDKPQMCIVSGWYWILQERILKKVPKGFIGIHPSLLPKYKGGAPLVWPIINGDKASGVSLFYLEKGMDGGDLIAQKSFNISEEDTIQEVMEKAAYLAIELLNENYPLLLEERAPRIQQEHSLSTYYPMRRPEDGRIKWNNSNIEIYNAIRAQTHPYPGAFCFTEDGRKLYIWKAKLFSQPCDNVAGLVLQISDGFALVSCGKGGICLYEVQFESATQEIASKVLKSGMRLI